MKRLLIISNNVLSETNNNGKTILSFVEGLKNVSIAQLYLSGETPKVKSYNYFRISDKDIIMGLFHAARRGRSVMADSNTTRSDDFSIRNIVGRNSLTQTLRDLLWWKKWWSKGLAAWLDEFNPEAVFFVAGDALFPYDICQRIVKRYNARLTVYVTDDYIMPRTAESLLHRIRRHFIKRKLTHAVNLASTFYTVSDKMRRAYKDVLHRDSCPLVNMTEDLYDPPAIEEKKEIVLTYAGSFYYKRADMLGKLASVIKKYNDTHENAHVSLVLYSNAKPTREILEQVTLSGASEYGGSLNREQLKQRLNTSDMLVFVESFDKEQMEKVRYSLSTKVPEYLSVGKPIIAIGPLEAGSMEYLKDVACCVYSEQDMDSIIRFIENKKYQTALAQTAREKYLAEYNKTELQVKFSNLVLGSTE